MSHDCNFIEGHPIIGMCIGIALPLEYIGRGIAALGLCYNQQNIPIATGARFKKDHTPEFDATMYN